MMADLTLSIGGDAESFVEAMAYRRGESAVTIVKRALEAYRFLHEVKEQDGEIVLLRKDGQLERLVRI